MHAQCLQALGDDDLLLFGIGYARLNLLDDVSALPGVAQIAWVLCRRHPHGLPGISVPLLSHCLDGRASRRGIHRCIGNQRRAEGLGLHRDNFVARDVLGQFCQNLTGQYGPFRLGHAVSTAAVCSDPIAETRERDDALYFLFRILATCETLSQCDEIQTTLGGTSVGKCILG
ncbi:hypothetical protein WS62_22865 [Burkholderia sp. ABCPW 14]|nr:hypothetical protein WS62_22865 [Burkholderia sp. ABCPW 14]